jgi:hypothetical protein
MAIAVEPYAEDVAEEWDAFVGRRARNATFLHSRAFLRHNPANAEDDASLVFRDGGRLVGVLPAALLRGAGADTTYVSHPRATYGGFVVGPEAGAELTIAMVDGAIAHARALGASRMVVRNPFRIFHLAPSDESDYALWLRGFTVRARELEVAVPTAGLAPDAALATFDGKTRNQVRKAQKLGVSVEESDAYAEFWPMLEANLRERHGTRPTHSLEAFERLRALVPPRAVRLVAARHDGRMVAGAVLFAANTRALHVQYIGSRADALHLCPVNAVVAHLVALAAAEGFHHLNLGMSTENEGRTPNLGLFAFKEGFGGRGVLRETLELSLRSLP